MNEAQSILPPACLSSEQRLFVDEYTQVFFGDGLASDAEQAHIDLHAFTEVDGQLVSHAAASRLRLTVDSTAIPTCSIGTVFTIPEMQGYGLASRLMERFQAHIHEAYQPGLLLLFCQPPLCSFYEQLGWSSLDAPVLLQQADKWIPWSHSVMHLRAPTDLLSARDFRVHSSTPNDQGYGAELP